MPQIKLAALDEDDLLAIAAHVQDAVLKMADLVYQPKQKLVAIALNRFDWLEAKPRRGQASMRRRALLRFERVEKARIKGLPLTDPDAVLSLLTVSFEPHQADAVDQGQDPGGTIVLVFSGGAEARLTVECIEAELADIGPAWSTRRLPDHGDDGSGIVPDQPAAGRGKRGEPR